LKVEFVPDAQVYGNMPGSLRGSAGQQQRWEAGRLTLLRRYWRPLLKTAIARRNPSAAVVLTELALPPLSVLVTAEAAIGGIALAAGSPAARVVAVCAPAALLAYVASGLVISDLGARSYLALLHAPRYVAWKLWVYFRELVRRADPAWIRTSRDRPA
jgi:hypothetical protein